MAAPNTISPNRSERNRRTDANSVINAGTLVKSVDAGTTSFTAPLVNAGTVQATSGTLDFAGGYTQSAGTTQLAGGTISGNLTITTGTLTGTGTVTGNVVNTGGTVSPGASPGTLTIDGNYAQGVTATLLVEIGGHTAGVDYDLLDVTGTVTLDGTLAIAHFGSFTPLMSDTFDVITYSAVSGDFAAVAPPTGYTYGTMPLAAVYSTAVSGIPSYTPPPPLPEEPADDIIDTTKEIVNMTDQNQEDYQAAVAPAVGSETGSTEEEEERKDRLNCN
jgi:hypothetical protein